MRALDAGAYPRDDGWLEEERKEKGEIVPFRGSSCWPQTGCASLPHGHWEPLPLVQWAHGSLPKHLQACWAMLESTIRQEFTEKSELNVNSMQGPLG